MTNKTSSLKKGIHKILTGLDEGVAFHGDTYARRLYKRVEATQALLKEFENLVNEVIGRGTHVDKEYMSEYGFIEQEAENKLRSQQRNKLKELLGGSKR